MSKIYMNAVESCDSASFTGKQRANFTPYHLLAAKNAAHKASEIENTYKSIDPPQEELDLYLSQASTAIICSVAALESNGGLVNRCVKVFQAAFLSKDS